MGENVVIKDPLAPDLPLADARVAASVESTSQETEGNRRNLYILVAL